MWNWSESHAIRWCPKHDSKNYGVYGYGRDIEVVTITMVYKPSSNYVEPHPVG